jgi:hypothetical protein
LYLSGDLISLINNSLQMSAMVTDEITFTWTNWEASLMFFGTAPYYGPAIRPTDRPKRGENKAQAPLKI